MIVGCVLFLLLQSICLLVAEDARKTPYRGLSDVDPLLESIELEQWNDDETLCVDAMRTILNGVKNSTLWATWIWDSIQRPTGFLYGSRYQLGNFGQCMNPPWLHSHPHLRTQYCLADIRLTDATPRKQTAPMDPYTPASAYFETTSKKGRYFNVLSWGVCLPSVCSQRSVNKMLQAMLRTQHLPPLTSDPHITIDSCQLAGEPVQYSTEFKAFLIVLLSLMLISIFSTYISGYMTKNSSGKQLVDSFDLNRNWRKFVEEPRDEITSVNGIKCINAGVLNTIHYILFANNAVVMNGLDVERDLESSLGSSMIHSDITVDTFIFISGLLLVKGLYGKQNNLVISLMKRYVRIIGPLIVMLFYFAQVHKYVGNGPLWPSLSSRETEFCKKNWWLNLLLISNYFRCSEMCYIVTWYIATDFHLTVLGSFLFYIHQKNSKLGKWLFGITFALTAFIPAFITYRYEMPAIYFSSIQSMFVIYTNEVYLRIHTKTHCRIAVYLLGMFMGYYMSRNKPAEFKNSISKKWSIVGVVIAFYMMYKVLRIAGSFFHEEYDLMDATIFAIYDRICWALAIGILIFVCEYGYAPIVTDILRFKPFGAASKLCYGIYLTHMALIYRNIYSTKSPLTHDFIEMITVGVGVFFAIIPVAMLMYFIVEAPAGNLANCLFKSRKPASPVMNGSVNGSVTIESTKNGIKPKVA